MVLPLDHWDCLGLARRKFDIHFGSMITSGVLVDGCCSIGVVTVLVFVSQLGTPWYAHATRPSIKSKLRTGCPIETCKRASLQLLPSLEIA